jgi:hypothetical protein
MNKKTVPLHFLVFLFSLSACVPATATVPPVSATESLPTNTAEPRDSEYYPLSTRTGIADIDAVLATLESSDPQELRDLIHFTTVACTNAEGLGGPPKCRENEAEGDLVNVLPFLGSEGYFLRESELSSFPGVNVVGLYAVYAVSDSAYSEEAYPKGEYAVLLATEDNQTIIAIQIREGIVRIDYLHSLTSLNEIVQRDASELILAPK